MEGKNHGSPSFVNVAALLLFAIVIAVASVATTYFVLNSRSNEQYSADQPSTIPQPQTNVLPTTIPVATTQTVSDETADWKIYTNTKVGFTIKYPERYANPKLPGGVGSDIYADGTEDNDDIIFGLTSADFISLIVFPFTGSVAEIVADNKTNIATTINNFRTAGRPNIKLKEDVVDGNNALWYLADNNEIHVYFTGKNHGFLINTDNNNHSRKEIEQILSTFKFLE